MAHLEQVDILGCQVHRVTTEEAVQEIGHMVARQGLKHVITLNAEIIYQALADDELRRIINKADLVTPDGAGVVWAAKRMGRPVAERVTGIDLLMALAERGAQTGWTMYFLGAEPGVAEAAAERLRSEFPGIRILGTHHGFFQDDNEVIASINLACPDILIVALGAPRQEKWIDANRHLLRARVAMGVGGSFDVISGKTQRAPQWAIRLNLEWLYRLLREPSRWRRQRVLPLFAWRIIWAARKAGHH